MYAGTRSHARQLIGMDVDRRRLHLGVIPNLLNCSQAIKLDTRTLKYRPQDKGLHHAYDLAEAPVETEGDVSRTQCARYGEAQVWRKLAVNAEPRALPYIRSIEHAVVINQSREVIRQHAAVGHRCEAATPERGAPILGVNQI